MNSLRIAAIALIVAGALGLAYGSFSFTKQTHEAKLGPIELSVNEKQTVNVPVWAGVGAIVVGGLLLLILPEAAFSAIVPFLLLLAAVFSAIQPRVARYVRSRARHSRHRGSTADTLAPLWARYC